MNDFTKEELQEIADSLRRDPFSAKSVMTKIQSMIDNCCEHESDGYCYYKSGIRCTNFLLYTSSESACLLKCKKCMELFDDGRP